MKILSAVVATSLIASVALAENSTFVGVSTGYNFVNKVRPEYNDVESPKDKMPSFGIKAGYDFGSYRAYGEYVYNLQSKDNIDVGGERRDYKWKSHDFAVGADYTPEISNGFRAVLGGYIGASVSSNEMDDTSVYNANDASGLLLGIRLGGLYELDMHSQVEFGIKTQRTTMFDNEGDADRDAYNDIYSFYLGYNFKF